MQRRAHPLRIAQIAPLHESVPPQRYGGTERVVSYLTEALVAEGHEVTLFASGDSVTAAHLVSCAEQGLRMSGASGGLASCLHQLQLEELLRRASDYDVVHFHTDPLHHTLVRHLDLCAMTTLHGRLDLPETIRLYREFRDQPLISISDHQRRPVPQAGWIGTVYHGLPRELYTARERPGDYLVFLGRISPEKRPDRAIEIARRAGMRLKIAAKVDAVDKAYFTEVIRPLMESADVELVGEVDDAGKQELLGGAAALLFPIDWPEPFGLVMIEALACGTPVIAWHAGSVPEVLRHGETGFIVSSVDEAVDAVGRLGRISRRRCRQVFEARFTAERMARDYVSHYLAARDARRSAAREGAA